MSVTTPPKRLGASVQPKYIHRNMPIYGVSELEIRQLSSFNDTATTYFSLAGATFGYAAAIWTNAAFYDGVLNPVGKLATVYLAPAMFILGAAFVFLAWKARGQRRALQDHLTNSDSDHA